MVCPECGKVKNRIEDFYNLSVDVGPRTLEESLAQLIAGETISDYKCSGCKKKVDVSKRMLLAETPSVLIVHLKRLVFNFDTFRNDKVNTFLEFPTTLDLKPYSYHEVMKKEGLVKEKKEGDEEEEEEQASPEQEGEKNEDESEEEENPIPIEDDCWEYKLVGMNIHSGTANAGHYWSYINTERASGEGLAEEEWMRTAEEPWCEFNDSRVSDWKVAEKMKEDCFGDEQGAGRTGYFGGGYGKSAYMLFYERRAKKPIKILVPE
jgi:ubiquitin carboxyl-terminal hydrolase 34